MTETLTDEAPDCLTLKWGTLKGWSVLRPSSFALLQRFDDLGRQSGAMQQKMTVEHKAILCELIRAVKGTIQNDWTGEFMTKDEAVKYVIDYGK